MKIRIGLLALMLVCVFTHPVSVVAQGTAFTYQGRLDDGTNAANGLYDIRASAWNAVSGGTMLSAYYTNLAVPVSNGLFTVQVDFGPGLFTGETAWLQIGVRSNGTAVNFTALDPRQEMTPTPYSIYAEGANAAGITGTIPMADLSGTYGGALALNNPANVFDGNGSGLTGVNAAALDGLGPNNFWQTTGNAGTTPGVNFVGTTDGQALEIKAPFVGINRTTSIDGNDYFTVRAFVTNTWGGINIETAGAGLPWYGYSQANGIYAYTWLAGTSDYSWNLYDDGAQLTFTPNGNFALDQYNENGGFIDNGSTTGAGLTFGINSGEGIASERQPAGNQYGLDFYTDFTQRMSLNQGGNLMVNSNDVYLLGTNASPGPQYSYGLGFRRSVAGQSPSGGDGPFLFGFDAGYLGTRDPDAVALEWDWHGNVWVSNNCSVASLTIRGGADLAEPFRISSQQIEIPKGAVMVIDEKNPGQLKISDRPYDTRVAGVLSGANGINPGIQMQQQGLLEGDRNVALSGRVYVLADAANGAIHPGDMLTTSATPGYAMKVTSHAKAEGAILGKAMTSLSDGKGMVLVLVTLQ
jgi:hypothetical protein